MGEIARQIRCGGKTDGSDGWIRGRDGDGARDDAGDARCGRFCRGRDKDFKSVD